MTTQHITTEQGTFIVYQHGNDVRLQKWTPPKTDTKFMAHLTIPHGITVITETAFTPEEDEKLWGEIDIHELHFPPSVHTIEDNAFYERTVYRPHLNEGLRHIHMRAFAHNHVQHITIPSTVKTIGRHAFYENKLETLTFADNSQCTDIGAYAFAYNQLQTVHLPPNVQVLQEGSFYKNPLQLLQFAPNQFTALNMNAFM